MSRGNTISSSTFYRDTQRGPPGQADSRLKEAQRRTEEYQQHKYPEPREAPVHFGPGVQVLCRNTSASARAFNPTWTGPHPIVAAVGDGVYMVDRNGSLLPVHVDDIRPLPPPRSPGWTADRPELLSHRTPGPLSQPARRRRRRRPPALSPARSPSPVQTTEAQQEPGPSTVPQPRTAPTTASRADHSTNSQAPRCAKGNVSPSPDSARAPPATARLGRIDGRRGAPTSSETPNPAAQLDRGSSSARKAPRSTGPPHQNAARRLRHRRSAHKQSADHGQGVQPGLTPGTLRRLASSRPVSPAPHADIPTTRTSGGPPSVTPLNSSRARQKPRRRPLRKLRTAPTAAPRATRPSTDSIVEAQ